MTRNELAARGASIKAHTALRQAQLREWPSSIFVEPVELVRLLEMGLGSARDYADAVASYLADGKPALCYVVPHMRDGHIHVHLGIRHGVEPADYWSF